LPMTHGSHCPPCFRFLRLCVTSALGSFLDASSYRFRPVRIPPSLLPSTLLSVTFIPGHLRPHRLPKVRGFCSRVVVRSTPLPSSSAPSFVTLNGGFSFLLSFLRRFLWERLLSTYLSGIRSFVAMYLMTFGLLRSLDLPTLVFPCFHLPLLWCLFLYMLASLRCGP
jgi:hypothetical protein